MGTNLIVLEIQDLSCVRKEIISFLKSRLKTKGWDYVSLELLDSLAQYRLMQKTLENLLNEHHGETSSVVLYKSLKED